MEKTKIELGKEYSFAGYKWVPVEINEDRQVAIMQSLGVTSGPWPGFSMEKFGNGDHYNKDITGQDISEYDDKTRALMRQIKPVISSIGLYLPSYENIEDDSVWKVALAKAADNYNSFGADVNASWLGTVGDSYYAWYVSSYGFVNGNSNQGNSYVVAPFFDLDLSKVEIEGDEICYKKSIPQKSSNMPKEIAKYLELMKERPEDFLNSEIIEIETDPEKICKVAEKLHRPVGVVYESPYHLMVVDVCIGENGYYTYERILPKVQKNAVVILLQAGSSFVLLKQYRHALRDFQYAFPRGFANENMSVEENAIRKLADETGFKAKSVKYLGTTVADSGLSGTKVSVYYANGSGFDLKCGHEGICDFEFLSLDKMKEWIAEGKITDGFTLSAMMIYLSQKD